MRYKQALLVWLGVAIISLVVAPQVNALLASWPFLLRMMVSTGITVALLTYWVMPFLTRCFKRWLFQT